MALRFAQARQRQGANLADEMSGTPRTDILCANGRKPSADEALALCRKLEELLATNQAIAEQVESDNAAILTTNPTSRQFLTAQLMAHLEDVAEDPQRLVRAQELTGNALAEFFRELDKPRLQRIAEGARKFNRRKPA